LIKGVMQHSRLGRLNGSISLAGEFQILIDAAWLHMDVSEKHEGCGLIKSGHVEQSSWLSFPNSTLILCSFQTHFCNDLECMLSIAISSLSLRG
jgi:hypothetical protein